MDGVEDGEDSKNVLNFSGRMQLAAMALLGLGAVVDLAVVTETDVRSRAVALGCAGLALMLLYGFWFGYTWLRRRAALGASRSRSSRLYRP